MTGLDLSEDMLRRARKKLLRQEDRIRLVHRAYDEPQGGLFDLVLFSYSLSMFNPGWERALECARKDLDDGGHIAVVDFHDTPVALFYRWMQAHHVCLDGHLLRGLEKTFGSRPAEIGKAFFGLWRYFTYIGEKASLR
jgi:S-adenosylmethionine-diacylgycerolhomoserine-N-methlytransferase